MTDQDVASDDKRHAERRDIHVCELDGRNNFQPLNLISVWDEPGTMTKRVTIAILLPCGIKTGSFSVRIVEDGHCLELALRWPQCLVDVNLLHKKWLGKPAADGGFEICHLRVLGFERALANLRDKSTDDVESVSHIKLPFAVQQHVFGKYNLSYHDGKELMVYIELKAVVRQYALTKDKDSFESM